MKKILNISRYVSVFYITVILLFAIAFQVFEGGGGLTGLIIIPAIFIATIFYFMYRRLTNTIQRLKSETITENSTLSTNRSHLSLLDYTLVFIVLATPVIVLFFIALDIVMQAQ